nr:hypothetical protein [uncultured Arthrobacter sp.]
MVNAEPRPGPRFQPPVGNAPAADFARPVTPLLQPLQGSLKFGDAGVCVPQQRGGLGKFEGNGRSLGIMFVVDIRVAAQFAGGREILTQ